MGSLTSNSSDFRLFSKANKTDGAVFIPKYTALGVPHVCDIFDRRSTHVSSGAECDGETYGLNVVRPDPVIPAIEKLVPLDAGVLAAVIQIWEGVVTYVDDVSKVMTVKLTDRQGLVPEHTADVGLDWVVEQDLDLVRPGAVFYWTIYKETKKSTIKHSQEIRFRRLPDWTEKQISSIKENGLALMKKFSSGTLAKDV